MTPPGPADLRARSRRRRFRVITVAVTTALLIVATELVLRVASPLPSSFPGVASLTTPRARDYGWALAPGSSDMFRHPDTGERVFFSINSRGWRDVEHTLEKPAGTTRILFVGDSVTFGFVALEDLYTRLVERELRARGAEVEVLSLGVGGWAPDQELEALRLEGLAYAPDVVVYQFSQNDLPSILLPDPAISLPSGALDLARRFKYELRDGRLARVDVEPTWDATSMSWRLRLLRSSALAHNLNVLRHRALAALGVAQDTIPPPPMYLGAPGYPPERSWPLLEALMLAMRAAVEETGATFVVFCESCEEGDRRWALDWGTLESDADGDHLMRDGSREAFDWWATRRRLEELCRRQGIPLVESRRPYIRHRNDPHANEEGNRAMAQDLVDDLLRRGLVKASR